MTRRQSPVALNPVAYTEHVVRSFLRYQLTAYPFADPRLHAQMRELLSLDETRRSPLLKGPYVSLSRPFRQGAAVDALIGERLLHPHLRERIPDAITRLYGHQERALRAIAAGRTTLVSTGTGSGKTECFLYPVVSRCLALRDEAAPAGVSAVIVYPMNALAEDQLMRLRGLLAGTGIPFGMYVGKTPEHEAAVAGVRLPAGSSRADYAARLARARRDGGGETVYPAEEVCSREVMRTAGRQPRILLTNVKQLELLLTRQQDVELFAGARLDFLVFDEAHTFTGALGAETACLVRRLRAFCGTDPARTTCIATSATIVDPGDPQAGRSFAARFFGVAADSVTTVGEDYESEVWTARRFAPPAPAGDTAALLDRAVAAVEDDVPAGQARAVPPPLDDDAGRAVEGDAPAGQARAAPPPRGDDAGRAVADARLVGQDVREVYRALAGEDLGPGDWPEALHAALSRNEIVFRLNEELAAPRALEALPPALGARLGRPVTEAEILAWLTLGAAARRDGRPLLRPVVHGFVRGIGGAVVSFPAERDGPRLWLAAEDDGADAAGRAGAAGDPAGGGGAGGNDATTGGGGADAAHRAGAAGDPGGGGGGARGRRRSRGRRRGRRRRTARPVPRRHLHGLRAALLRRVPPGLHLHRANAGGRRGGRGGHLLGAPGKAARRPAGRARRHLDRGRRGGGGGGAPRPHRPAPLLPRLRHRARDGGAALPRVRPRRRHGPASRRPTERAAPRKADELPVVRVDGRHAQRRTLPGARPTGPRHQRRRRARAGPGHGAPRPAAPAARVLRQPAGRRVPGRLDEGPRPPLPAARPDGGGHPGPPAVRRRSRRAPRRSAGGRRGAVAGAHSRSLGGGAPRARGGRHEQERRKYLRFQVLREVTLASRQALGLEPWGRMKVEYAGLDASLPWIQQRAHELGLSAGRLQEGVAGVLDYLRRRRALHDPEHEVFTKYWKDGDREVQQGYLPNLRGPAGTKLRCGAAEKPALVIQWLSEAGRTTMRQVARKWEVLADAAGPFLESLFAFLTERGLLVPVRLKGSRGHPLPNVSGIHQVNADRLRLSPNRGVWRCRSCRRTTTRGAPRDRCMAWRCDGTLEWVREDDDSYDLQLLDGAYSMLRSEEHTAMVPADERERLENLFKGGSEAVNCLVCTPTLELGIDIGRLDSVLMRNVPPLPANYRQRAGRAGRRHRMAVDLTYCRPVSHDRAYFAEPLKLLDGRIDPPAFNLRNDVMIAKHVHATILGALHGYGHDAVRPAGEQAAIRDVLHRCLPRQVEPYLFEDGEVRRAPFDFGALRGLVRRHAGDLAARVEAVFRQGWPAEAAGVAAPAALRAHVDAFADELERVVARLRGRLQSFRNAYYHRHLDRGAAREQIDRWGRRLSFDHDIPRRQPDASPEEQAGPVNDVEMKLRHLLLAAGFGEGVRDQQVRLDRTLGTTTPDVIYRGEDHDPDEGVCIYLDGLSRHLHGNPETAERDRDIRSWLRNHGYDVIEIAANELDDEDAMVRHFRRLARNLNLSDLRRRLLKDRSWFRDAATGGAATTRPRLRLIRSPSEVRDDACVPLVPLEAAGGAFGHPHAVPDPSEWDWVEVETARSLRPGMFAAQVVGRSMEPGIPDGSYSSSRAPSPARARGGRCSCSCATPPTPTPANGSPSSATAAKERPTRPGGGTSTSRSNRPIPTSNRSSSRWTTKIPWPSSLTGSFGHGNMPRTSVLAELIEVIGPHGPV